MKRNYRQVIDQHIGFEGIYMSELKFKEKLLSPYAPKLSMRKRRKRGKNLCVHGEDAKRLLAYQENTPRDIKMFISQLIKIRIKKNLYSFFYTIWDGLSLKTISRYCPFKEPRNQFQSGGPVREPYLTYTGPPGNIGWLDRSLKSIPGLLELLQIRALFTVIQYSVSFSYGRAKKVF